MREIRTSGSEGGGIQTNRFSLPLSTHRHTEVCDNSNALLVPQGRCGGAMDPRLSAGVTR